MKIYLFVAKELGLEASDGAPCVLIEQKAIAPEGASENERTDLKWVQQGVYDPL